MCEVDPCSESFVFKGFFPDWDDEFSTHWLELDPFAAAMAKIEADKKASIEAKMGKKEEVKFDAAGSKTYDLEVLKRSFPEGVDPTKKEQYLSDEVFSQVFKMDKTAFNALKEWKRKDMKKQAGLF